MKKVDGNIGHSGATPRQGAPPPPPLLPPPLPRFWARKTVVTESVTNREIAKFWRQKRVDEEDHLLAAIKAAARVMSRNLSEEDYKYFMESLDDNDKEATKENIIVTNDDKKTEHGNEVHVGVKDWWTQSKYAYLNQPAIGSNDPPKPRTSTFVPSCFSFKPNTPIYPTSLGVF